MKRLSYTLILSLLVVAILISLIITWKNYYQNNRPNYLPYLVAATCLLTFLVLLFRRYTLKPVASIKAEKMFRSLLESAPDAMIIINDKGNIILVNQQTEKLFEYSREDLIGHPVEILIPQELKPSHVGHRKAYFKEPKVRSMGAGLELQAVKKNGQKFPVEISLSPLHTNQGILVSASVRDITDRKKAEQRFKGLLDAAPDATVIVNEEGIIEMINKQTENIFGYPRNELLGQPIEILIPHEVRKRHVGHRKNFVHHAGMREMGVGLELSAVRKDGSQFPVEISLSPIQTEEGMLVSASVRDITERKKVQAALMKLNEELEQRVIERTEALHTSEKKFRALVENNDGIIALLDKDLRVSYRSPSSEYVTGWATEERNHIGTMGQVHPEDNAIFQDAITKILSEPGRMEKLTFRSKHKDGHYIWLEGVMKNMFHDPSVGAIITNFKDVTDRMLAENALKKNEAELEEKVRQRTDQLETSHREMEAFTYSVSHDLRAPLRGIIGFTSILQEEYASKLDDEGKRITSVIKNNTLKMGQLIDELLNFSRIGKQEIIKTDTNSNKLVREVIESIEIKNNNTKVHVDPLPFVKADINTLRQVWINLVTNAVKYSAKNESPEISIGFSEEKNNFIFFVRDNGVGFDKLYANKLFKVFQRLHSPSEFEGTGVGLAIVEKIISKHGGRVWAEGEVDKGATFYFSLPKY